MLSKMKERSAGGGFRKEKLLCGMAVTYFNWKTDIRAFCIAATSFQGSDIPIWIYCNMQLSIIFCTTLMMISIKITQLSN
jgi:valyl-tRNA synthetase